MFDKKALIIVSLGLNLIFAGFAVAAWFSPKPLKEVVIPWSRASGPGSFSSKDSGISGQTDDTASQEGRKRPGASSVVAQIDWQQVESEDFHQYAANLRALGLPHHIVDDILRMDVNRYYMEAIREYQTPVEYQYWRQQVWHGIHGNQKRIQELMQQKNALIKELTGKSEEEYIKELYRGNFVDQAKRVYGDIPEERVKRLQEVEKSFNERIQEVHANTRGMFNQMDQIEIEKINQEKLAAFKAMMTPEEWRQYQLRNSNTAQQLRSMVSFEMTEEEYLQLFDLRAPYDEKYSRNHWEEQTQEFHQERQKAMAELDEKIKQTLSPERYEEYKMSQDWKFTPLYQITQRMELPRSTAVQAYKIVQDIENQINALPHNTALDAAAKREEHARLKKQLEDSLTGILTEKGAQAFMLQARHLTNRRF